MGCKWYERMEKYFLWVLKFVYFWLGSLSASTRESGNLHHSALILPNHWSLVTNKSGGVQIFFLLGAENAGISCFLRIFE